MPTNKCESESRTSAENVIRARKLIIYTAEYILSMKFPLHNAPSQILRQSLVHLLFRPVAIRAALEADLAECQHDEQAHVPGDQPQPEWGGQSRASGEMCQLRANAAEEQPRQAVPVDERQARRRQPSDEPKPNHGKIPPQPVPIEARRLGHHGSPLRLQRLSNKSRGQVHFGGGLP